MDKDSDQSSLNETVGRMIAFHTWLTSKKGTAEGPSVVWMPLNSTSASEVATTVCRVLDLGANSLISALKCHQRKVVSGLAEIFQIPHLSVDLDLCPSSTPEEFTIHLSTMYQNIGMLLVDITRAASCKEVALITDDISGPSFRQSIIVQLSLTGVRTVLVSFSPNRETDWSGIHKHIVVISGSHRLQMILRQLQEEDFTWRRDYYVWAYVTDLSDTRVIGQLLKPYKNINIAMVKPNSVFLSESRGLPCLGSGQTFTLLGIPLWEAVQMLHRAFHFVVNASIWNHREPFCSVKQPIRFGGGVQLLKQLKLISNSQQCSVCGGQCTSGEFRLFTVPAGPDRRLTCAGQWSEKTRLTPQKTSFIKSLFANHETDFHGIILRVAVVRSSYPFVGHAGPGNGSFEGVTIDILNDLSISLNFRYVLLESKDGYGVNLGNGSWSGMVGMIARGEVDLAACPMTMTSERSKVVDFTTPFLQDGLGIVTPTPKETTNLFQVFNPFSLQVWSSVLGFFLLAVVMTVCTLLTRRYPSSSRCRDGSERQSVQDNILLLISAFCQLGPTFYPTSVSTRCFLSFWFVFTILTMAMYTANLAAVLTVSTPLWTINSLQDLVHQTEFAVGVNSASSTWDLFKLSEEPLYKQTGERMVAIPSLSTLTISTSVKDGHYCYIGDRYLLEYMVSVACGQIRLADERFHSFSVAFALPKGSLHKQAIDIKIQKMLEFGFIDRWKRKWSHRSVNCSLPKTTGSTVSLGMDRIGGVFVLYLGFALTACLVLLAERTYSKLTKTNFT